MSRQSQDRYPATLALKDGEAILRPINSDDRQRLLLFAAGVPEHDLMFLRRNIAEPKVLDAWISAAQMGQMLSLVAVRDDDILGCTALLRDDLSWSSHVGEVRVLVGPSMREQGLGRLLIQACFLEGLAMGLEKLFALMTPDQEAAITVFEDMGFRAEGMLRDHVKDSRGEAHDLMVLSHDVGQSHAQKAMYGVTDAF